MPIALSSPLLGLRSALHSLSECPPLMAHAQHHAQVTPPSNPPPAHSFICHPTHACPLTQTVVLLYQVLRTVRIPGLSPAKPLLALMLGASCAFATPIGFQTNLMVQARGSYRFVDFVALGGLLTLVVGTTICLLIHVTPAEWLPLDCRSPAAACR